jgi:DNA mismatch repair protein MutS
LAPGGSTHSFGIHVAQMAGMPPVLIKRAEEILRELEKKQGVSVLSEQKPEVPGIQLSIFDTHTEVFAGIREMMSGVDINNLTPVEALVILSEIKKKIN